MREILTDVIEFFSELFSAHEAQIFTAGGCIAGGLCAIFGGFDKQFMALFTLTVVDVITGIYAAWHTADPEQSLWSVKLYKGLLKKITIYFAVALAVEVDIVTKTDFCRYATIAGFGTMEALSIVENSDRGGWGDWIPSFLRNHLKELQQRKNLAAAAKEAATVKINKPAPASDPAEENYK